MFRRSTFALNNEVEDADSQETQCDELRQLVDAQLQAELKGKDEGQSARWQPSAALRIALSRNRHSDAEVSWTAWSLFRVPGRPDSERDDHRVSAHEAKVSVV